MPIKRKPPILKDISDEEIRAVLKRNGDKILPAAKEIGCSRQTLSNYLAIVPWWDSAPPPTLKGIEELKTMEKNNIKKVLRDERGILIRAADRLGVTRQALKRHLDKYPELQELATSEREGVKDRLEDAAWKVALGIEHPDDPNKWLQKPDPKMLQFLLKTMVQDRGYYDGPQFGQGNPDQRIVINIGGKFVEEDDPAVEVEHEPLPALEDKP
jgi:hypothetical protein